MPTNVCVVGATGRFGRSIISQKTANVRITGAVTSDTNTLAGKKLRDIGLLESDVVVRGASKIEDAIAESDVVLFVATPDADMQNIPRVIGSMKRIVVGTTGFTEDQLNNLNSILNRVPSVLSSNFSIGANIVFQIARLISKFETHYDFSIVEEHHKHKVDAPSGTAKTIFRNLNGNNRLQTVTDRTVKPKHVNGDVEILSLRAGGTPGIHQLICSGENDMIKIEHFAFSRAAVAEGALLACSWIASNDRPGVYSMQDVLGLS